MERILVSYFRNNMSLFVFHVVPGLTRSKKSPMADLFREKLRLGGNEDLGPTLVKPQAEKVHDFLGVFGCHEARASQDQFVLQDRAVFLVIG
jgi:hypothetical protein